MSFQIGWLDFFLALLGFCALRIRAQGRSWTTARRWLPYIVIALLMIGAFGGFFVYAAYKEISDELAVKWMNIFLTTLFVFGYTVKKFWPYRKRWTFWAELLVLISVHFMILQHLAWQKASYFGLS